MVHVSVMILESQTIDELRANSFVYMGHKLLIIT